MGEKVKSELLKKKTKRNEADQYLTAQKVVKNYRERQKSHAAFKRNVYNRKKTITKYEEEKEGAPIIAIRISGYLYFINLRNWERISKEIRNILQKLKLGRLYSAVILKYDKETFSLLNLIEPYTTWG